MPWLHLWAIVGNCFAEFIERCRYIGVHDLKVCIKSRRGRAMFWIIFSAGCPTNLDDRRRTFCACNIMGAGGGCVDMFLSRVVSFSYLPLSGRLLGIHRLKCCLEEPLNP